MLKRRLKPEEINLITWMIKDTKEGIDIIRKLDTIIVEEMKDGGMGSLRVVKEGKDDRRYSKDLAKADLYDVDQVPVFISIVLDTNNDFFEFEVFKADFSPLKKIPAVPS